MSSPYPNGFWEARADIRARKTFCIMNAAIIPRAIINKGLVRKRSTKVLLAVGGVYSGTVVGVGLGVGLGLMS